MLCTEQKLWEGCEDFPVIAHICSTYLFIKNNSVLFAVVFYFLGFSFCNGGKLCLEIFSESHVLFHVLGMPQTISWLGPEMYMNLCGRTKSRYGCLQGASWCLIVLLRVIWKPKGLSSSNMYKKTPRKPNSYFCVFFIQDSKGEACL